MDTSVKTSQYFTITGHKTLSDIELRPIFGSRSMWNIYFNGALAYGGHRFNYQQALEHLNTFRKQYSVQAKTVIGTPIPSPEDVAKVLGNSKADVKQMRKLAKKLSGK